MFRQVCFFGFFIDSNKCHHVIAKQTKKWKPFFDGNLIEFLFLEDFANCYWKKWYLESSISIEWNKRQKLYSEDPILPIFVKGTDKCRVLLFMHKSPQTQQLTFCTII